MRKALVILSALLALSGTGVAQTSDTPDHAFLWNTFSSFREVDGYAIVTADYGLAVLEYDTFTEKYHQVGELLTGTAPFTSKRFGDVLAVQTWANLIYLVDVSDLPNLTLLGTSDIAVPFYDFALKEQNLYIAAGFEGLLRYQLTNYNDPVLVDSNLTGVHNIQVDIYDNEMLVLDDYNAVLRYDLSAPGFGDFVDYFWLPLQAGGFARIDSTLIFPLNSRSKAFIGHYGASGPEITDTITLTFKPQMALAVDTHFVVLSSQADLMQTISRQSHSGIIAALPKNAEPYLDGAAFARGGESHLVIPSEVGGLWDFNLDDLWFNGLPREVHDRPGPIVDVYLTDGNVITAGRHNPFEVYSIDPDSGASIDTTLFGLSDISSIAQAGNVYLVYYPDAASVFVVQVENGSIEIVNTIDIGTNSSARDIQYYDTDPIDTLNAMLVLGDRKVDVYGLSSDWAASLVYTADPEIQADVLDAIIVDSFLVFSSANNELHGYKIYSDFTLYHWWTISTPDPIYHLVNTGPRRDPDGSPLPSLLLGFSGPEMYTIDIPNVEVATIELTETYPMIEIVASAVFDNSLYTVGDFGMGRFDLAYDPPVLVDQWGFPGNRISLDSNSIAITDGSAILMYPLTLTGSGFFGPDQPQLPEGQLGQNYPNPFNPRTTIDYYLPEPTRVSLTILNVLGQTVATLVDGAMPAGQYSVTWDGTANSGERVASGVYFYRLITPDRLETRKMVVLK